MYYVERKLESRSQEQHRKEKREVPQGLCMECDQGRLLGFCAVAVPEGCATIELISHGSILIANLTCLAPITSRFPEPPQAPHAAC